MKITIIALSALAAALAATPALAGPPADVTGMGTGVAATAWAKQKPSPASTPYALTGTAPLTPRPLRRETFRFGTDRVVVDTYRR